MKIRLYGMSISHPARAARLMLEHKGLDYELVNVPAGAQAVRVRLAGFRGGTVPALRLDGRRVQGSRAISRALDEIQPDPPLFPRDPDGRARVEEAEAWGEHVLQPVPRRLLRWALSRDREARERFLRTLGLPRPAIAARLIAPVTAYYARFEDAGSGERVLRDREELPAHLDQVDQLIAAGTLAGEELNAADFQIGTTLRVMLGFADFEPLLAGRPGAALAERVWPGERRRLPPLLPADA